MLSRYREPDQELVLGEVMSFYLARLLGITTVPAVILSQVSRSQRSGTSKYHVSMSKWKHPNNLLLAPG